MGHVALKKALPAYVNALPSAANETTALQDSGVRRLESTKDHVLLEVNGRSVLGLVKHQREIGFAGEAQLSTACDVMLENVLDEALKSSEAIILKFALFSKNPQKPQPQVFHPATRQGELGRHISTNPMHDALSTQPATHVEHAASVGKSLDYCANKNNVQRRKDKKEKHTKEILDERKIETKEEEEEETPRTKKGGKKGKRSSVVKEFPPSMPRPKDIEMRELSRPNTNTKEQI
jgi:hypothetical protein